MTYPWSAYQGIYVHILLCAQVRLLRLCFLPDL